MVLWIVYNNRALMEKTVRLPMKIAERARELGVEAYAVGNEEVQTVLSAEGVRVVPLIEVPLPDRVLFWSKDVYLGYSLERAGIPVVNAVAASELADDKYKTLLRWSREGLPIGRTLALPYVNREQMWTADYRDTVARLLGEPYIVKSCKGSFGRQVFLPEDEESLMEALSALGCFEAVAQEYVKNSRGRDIRVMVLGGCAVGAMERRNAEDFRSNIDRGGCGVALELTEDLRRLAERAVATLGLEICGLDILYGDSGYVLCEANPNPNYFAFEQTTTIDFTTLLIEYLMNKKEEF